MVLGLLVRSNINIISFRCVVDAYYVGHKYSLLYVLMVKIMTCVHRTPSV